MKVFRVIIFLFAALCGLAFLLPKEVAVTRTVEVDATQEMVFDQVNTLSNWENGSVWNQVDSAAVYTYSEQNSGKNAWYTWEGELVGKGKLTIIESIENRTIKTELDFYERGKGSGQWKFTQKNRKTEVSWTYFADLGYNPLARWVGLTLDSMLGSSLEMSLQNLSDYCKKQDDENQNQIEFVMK